MEARRQQAAIEREQRYLEILRKRISNPVVRRRRYRQRQRRLSQNSNISNSSDLTEAFQNLYCENRNNPGVNPPNMAQAAPVNFDPLDPIFNTLDPAVQAHLNNLLAQQVAANRIVHEHRINTTNTNISIPVYNHKTMTSDTFLQKCRTYLLAQGHSPAIFHELLPMILQGEYKLWYDSICNTIHNWDDFMTAFKHRYDNDMIQRSRQRLLHTRRQGSQDPTEQFIYEMINLARQIDPLEELELSLKRARDALLPDIAALVGDCNPWTLDNLLERCSSAHELLNRQSRLKEKKPADIPPLKGLREELEKKESSNRNGNGRGNRNDSFRGRGSFRGRNYGHSNNRDSFQQRFNNQRRENEADDRVIEGRSYRGNDRNRGGRNGNRTTDMSKIKCNKCQKFGHFARDCRSAGVVLTMPRGNNKEPPVHYTQNLHPSLGNPNEDSDYAQAPHPSANEFPQDNYGYSNNPTEFQPQPQSSAHSRNTGNLNYQGRNQGSSGRGYSRT